MILPIDYDPAEHEIIDCQEGRHLQVATGFDNLVTYRHRELGTWVVALTARWPDGRTRLAEVGMLGTGAGEGRWLTKANRDTLVMRLKNLQTKDQVKAGIRQFKRGRSDWIEEVDDEHREGVQACYDYLKRTKGQVRAERYAQQAAGIPISTAGR